MTTTRPRPADLGGRRVALVHDWLTGMRGGEKALEAIRELVPDADLFTMLMMTRFRERPSRWFTLLGLQFLLLGLVAASVSVLTGFGIVVPATVALISMMTFGYCVLLGVLGEAAIEFSRSGAPSRIIVRDRTES